MDTMTEVTLEEVLEMKRPIIMFYEYDPSMLNESDSEEYDDETKDLIIRAFRNGLFQNPSIVEELKSSSLIESDYFEDNDED